MRDINLIVIHCSDSDNPKHDNAQTIDIWHKQRKFKKIGYQFFIQKNGTIEIGRKLREVGAHTKGFNTASIGICFSGKEDFTDEQKISGRILIQGLLKEFNLSIIDVLAHNELNKNKTCPNFPISEIFQVGL